jgi:hypothetical protein
VDKALFWDPSGSRSVAIVLQNDQTGGKRLRSLTAPEL